ncbi:hypothetical protein MTO96_001412 [Rhipicephalus appendiculatus]
MRRRRVKESRFKTVSYQYPDLDIAATDTQAAYRGHVARSKNDTEKGLPRQHQATQTSRTAAQGGDIGNRTDNTTIFPPGLHANQPNNRAIAHGNRRGVEGFKRQQARAHRPPPSSSSSSECPMAQTKNFNRRRTRNKARKSRSAMSTLPLKTAVYGECATPQQRADSSGDEGDDAGQQTSKGCLLSRNYKPGVHFYNESDRVYYERRMARRIQARESPEECSCESDAEEDWQRILADNINLPADPGRTERWVRAHYPLVAQPLRAESAADPVLAFGEAASPPKREAQTLETRNQQAKRDTACNNAKKNAPKATFGNTGKLADAAGEEKTQFYTCSSQLSEEAGEQPSDGTWWSPTSLLLPPMPQMTPQERSKILRSIRSDGFYTDDMAIFPTLQNRTSHNLMLTGGISHHSPTNYLDGSAVILYNPHNRAWFFFGTMPEPRCYHTTVLVGGSIIVAGECGLDPLNVTSSGRMQPSSKAFFFSIQKQRWYNMANMHNERAFHAAVGWSDCVIVFGGLGLTGVTSRSAEIYSSKTNQWTLVHPMPKALMGMAAVTVDNSIWIFGGVTRDSEGSSIEDVTYVFDPRTDAWVTHSPMTMKRAFSSAVSVQRDIWLVGGIVNLRPLECTDRIDVLRGAHDSWEPRAALPLPMHSVRIVKTGSEVYLVGGQTMFNNPHQEIIVFNRAQRRFIKCTETPKTLIGFAAVLLPQDSTVLRRYPLSSSKATPQERRYAATVIQRAYRHYRREGTLTFHLKNMRYPSTVAASREPSMTQWRHTCPNDLVPVHIEKWPPSQPSTTTVNADDGTGERSTKKYAHYSTLRADMDPNLGMLQHMDGSFLKTRLALGLRMTPEWMSSGLRQLKQTQQPRDPFFPVILVIGGLDPRNPLGSSGSAVLKYHPLKDRWMLVNAMPEPRTYHAVAYINDTIFVTGGYSTLNRKNGEMVATKTTFIMNTETGNWERLPDMLDERACHASVATDGRIIVFGGRGHDGRLLSSVEAYDFKNDKWKRLNSMPEPRMGMTAVAKDRSIWLLGGMSERHNSPTVSEVLQYSLQLDSWTPGSPLRLPRAFSSATLINGNIWLCGGCSNITEEKHPVSMDSIDVSSRHSKWKKTCTLGVARHSASIATIGSCIFIFGGINSQEWGVLSKSTLVITDRKAVVSPSPMPQAVSGHATVTLLPSRSLHPISSTKWSDAIFEKHA